MPNREVIKDMLIQMDVPSERLNLTTANLQWLLRNLGVRNNRHKKFGDCIGRIQRELQLTIN